MKLRNKKTGDVIECEEVIITKRVEDAFTNPYTKAYRAFSSIAELNAEWEDYQPTDPLIKDEKIRKAVRAWAEANDINSDHCYGTDVKFNSSEHEFTWVDTSIQFNEITGLENLKHRKRYTIDELCGEEEE